MADYHRFYLILRPARGNATGHARLEQRDSRAQISLCVHGLEERYRLRVLLFAGLETHDAVIDLGSFETGENGRGSFSRSGILLPGRAQLSACHTLALCLDWPRSLLMLAAPLNQSRPAAPWKVQEAVSRYLAVPVKAPELPLETPAPPPPDPPPEQSAVEPSPVSTVEVDPQAALPAPLPCPDVPPQDPSPQPWLDALMPLYWPESIRELKIYFDLLMPCAPFDTPGWRFVKAPLPHGGPGPFCFIGITVQGNIITQAAYALPAKDASAPPNGLEGYAYEAGQDGQGYWVLRQQAH